VKNVLHPRSTGMLRPGASGLATTHQHHSAHKVEERDIFMLLLPEILPLHS